MKRDQTSFLPNCRLSIRRNKDKERGESNWKRCAVQMQRRNRALDVAERRVARYTQGRPEISTFRR